MNQHIGTLLIDFMLVDYSKSFPTDHFDWEKNQRKDFKNVVAAVQQMLLSVPHTMIKDNPYFYYLGSDERQYYPAHHFYVLRDIRNYDGLIRLFNIYQAIALLYRENQVNFKDHYVKYDEKAAYRIDFHK